MNWTKVLLFVAIGYALGYWMPQLGSMTLGKVGIPRG